MSEALTEQFGLLVSQPDAAIELDRAMFVIAAHERPSLDIDGSLSQLDDLAARCSEPTLDGVSRQLFRFDGYAGNAADYYDVENSLLDRVMERKTGIPITLSVLAIEVGKRLGVPMDPVGMPGHFLVRDRVLDDVFLDPFHGGAVLSAAQCRRFFHTMHGPNAPWSDGYLDPVGKGAVLFRTLNNLRAISNNTGEVEREIWVLRLMSRIPGMQHEPAMALTDLLVDRGQYDAAADEFELFANAVEAEMPQVATQSRNRAVALRSQLN